MSEAVLPVIAVDGPSGSGKSSVSREVARRLGLAYLDTGAMYRAVAWWLLRRGVDVGDAAAVAAAVAGPDPLLEIGTDPSTPTVRCAGVDVSQVIRGPEVTAAVSPVSAVPAVRARLLADQRDQVAAAVAAGTGIVVEGRDIGSVVLPDARLKVFLTADARARAARRAHEDAVREGGDQPGAARLAATAESLRRRDAYDSGRAASPLARAADAVVVDATDLDLNQVVEAVLALARDAFAAASPPSRTS